jgi:hypothetical protein
MDEFIELVCGDADLLREEFDAIVTQEWADWHPPDSPKGTHKADEPRSLFSCAQARLKPPVGRSPLRAMRERNRQRSPPW